MVNGHLHALNGLALLLSTGPRYLAIRTLTSLLSAFIGLFNYEDTASHYLTQVDEH